MTQSFRFQREMPQAFQKPGSPLLQRCKATVPDRDQGMLCTQGFAAAEGSRQIVHRIFPLPLGPNHVVIGVSVVFRSIDLHRHLEAVDQPQDGIQIPVKEIRRIGMRPAAPELDIIITHNAGI